MAGIPDWLANHFPDEFNSSDSGNTNGTNGASSHDDKHIAPSDLARVINGQEIGPYVAAAFKAIISEVEEETEGGRNHTLNKAAFRLGQFIAIEAILERDVRMHLESAARLCGLGESEMIKTINSGITAGKLQPAIITLRAGKYYVDVGDWLEDKPPTVVPSLIKDEDQQAADFWDSRTVLSHLYHFALSRRVSPWAVLGVSMVRALSFVDHEVCLPPIIGGKASLNLFVGLIGPSGSGKGAAIAVAREALITLDEPREEKLGSGQGIAHAFGRWDSKANGIVRSYDSIIFVVDEIDHLLANSKMLGSNLLPELRSMFMGEKLGALYANREKRVEIPEHTYRAGLLLGIQPERSGVLIKDTDGGTPQRFLWMPTLYSHPDIKPDNIEPLVWGTPGLSGELRLCLTAQTDIDTNHLKIQRGDASAIDGHRLLVREKVAAALSILCGESEITTEFWDLANVVMTYSDYARQYCIDTLSSAADKANVARAYQAADREVIVKHRVDEDMQKKVNKAVMTALGDDELTHGALRHKLRSDYRDYFDVAIDTVVHLGLVEKVPSGKGYRYKRRTT